MGFCEDIRVACRAVVAGAASVHIDEAALLAIAPGEPPRLDPSDHYVDGPPEQVATYVLALDAVNFGSGWFAELSTPGRAFTYEHVAGALAAPFRAGPVGLASLDAAELFGLPAGHELAQHFDAALGELAAFLGGVGRSSGSERPEGPTSAGRGAGPAQDDDPTGRGALALIAGAEGSAERLAASLAAGMTMWRDPLAKRAQLAASDLVLAGVADFGDLHALTLFADNLVPHVLRREGALLLAPELERRIDAGELLPPGREEHELRAASVVAGERLARHLGVSERDLDGMLWQRGQAPRYASPPPHRCRTTAY